MYCKHCGKEIDDSATFCQHCGGSVSAQEVARPAPTKNKKTPLIIGITLACVVLVGAFGIFAKQSADRKRAEEEALAASIAESESIAEAEAIAESIAQAEVIAESIAQAERLEQKQARAKYIDNLKDFAALTWDGLVIAEDMCQIVYMVWYDTEYEEYRDETAAYTMTDGVYHDDVTTSFDALIESVDMQKLVADLESNKKKVSAKFEQLKNPAEEFAKCYEIAEDMMDAYIDFYTLAMYYPDCSLGEYSSYYDECTDAYIKYYEKFIMRIPEG